MSISKLIGSKIYDAKMNIQNAYNEWAEIYDSNTNLTRDLDQKVTRDVLGGQKFNSILEIGCGTGKNTVFLAQIGLRVQALDFSEAMIEKAREKVKADNVHFSRADITNKWPCDGEGFDLIVCNLVLEHIKDLSYPFAEATRCLQENGRFLVNELHPSKQYKGTKARFEKGSETVEVEAFVHHISEFIQAATTSGLNLMSLNEYWHEDDKDKPPRIISFIFEKK